MILLSMFYMFTYKGNEVPVFLVMRENKVFNLTVMLVKKKTYLRIPVLVTHKARYFSIFNC